MEKRITFQTIEETAEFIREHADTSHDYTLNDCIMFGGGGVHAYATECREAGISTKEGKTFHRLNKTELLQLLAWLLDNDGQLTVR